MIYRETLTSLARSLAQLEQANDEAAAGMARHFHRMMIREGRASPDAVFYARTLADRAASYQESRA